MLAFNTHVKKVLALVLAFAMAFTMMATAGAAYTDSADIEATEAVDMLSTLGIMAGDPDGSFRPNDTITRAEACRMIYSIRTNSDNADAYANMQTTFKDVPADAWYAGYVKHCQAAGIVSGTSATTFEPNRDVTGVELALMCLRVMGYDPEKADIGGSTWSTKTISLATEAGLLDGVNTPITSACPRQWAAQLMYNMIQASTVRWSDDFGGYNNTDILGQKYETVGAKYLKVYTIVGTLTSVDNKGLTITQSNSDVQDTDPAARGITSFSQLTKDYSDMLGQKVKVLIHDLKSNEVIGLYALNESTTYVVNASSVESDGAKVKVDGKSYSLESAKNGNDYIDVYFVSVDGVESGTGARNFTNAAGTTFTSAKNDGTYYAHSSASFDNWDNSSAVMKFVDVDTDGRLDAVYITDYVAAEVTSASSSKVVAGKSYDVADNTVDEGLAIGDWVAISHDRYNDCTRVAKAELTTGTLNGLKTGSTMKNGTAYNQYQIGEDWAKAANNAYTDLNTVRGGDNVQAVIVNGNVWMIKRASGDGTLGNVTDVALVVNVETSGVGGKQAKLQFFNDTTAVVDIDSNSRVPAVGEVCEYSISGGKYTFLSSLNTTADFYGDYTYVANNATYTIGSESIGTMKIDDTAKVILFDNNGSSTGNDSKVISGKQLKALTATDMGFASGTTTVTNVTYFTAKVNNLDRAAALALTVNSLPSTTAANTYYAYILSDAKETAVNEISYTALLEGSDEVVTIYEKNTSISARKANTLIGYKSLGAADDAGKRYIDDVRLYDTTKDAGYFGLSAITDVAGNNSAVQIAGVGEKKITSDTAIFYIDTDAKTGSTTGTITKAVKYVDAGVPVVSGSDTYVANALYVVGTPNDELEVLVVEAGDRQFRGPYAGYNAESKVMATLPTVSTIVTTPTLVNSSNASVVNQTVKAGDVLTLKANLDASGRKVKVTLTGATFADGSKEKVVEYKTGTADLNEQIKVDGSSADVKVAFEVMTVKLTAVAYNDGTGALSGADSTSRYVINTRVDGAYVSANDFVPVGSTVEVLVQLKTAPAAGKSDVITIKNGTTSVGSAMTFHSATATGTTQTVSLTATEDVNLSVAATTGDTTKATITSVTMKDALGTVTTDVTKAATVEVTFSEAMDTSVTAFATSGNDFLGSADKFNATVAWNQTGTVATLTVKAALAANDTLTASTNVVTATGAAVDTAADVITFVAISTDANGYQIG